MKTAFTLFARLLGFSVVKSPEAIRISVPKWGYRLLGPPLLEKASARVIADHPEATVRIYGRSLVLTLPPGHSPSAVNPRAQRAPNPKETA